MWPDGLGVSHDAGMMLFRGGWWGWGGVGVESSGGVVGDNS